MFKRYRKTGITEMRPYIKGEDLLGVSVSAFDNPNLGGMVARNSEDHNDQWYVAKEYFQKNYEEVMEVK